MKIYLYAKSGHKIGLDYVRRCACIANKIKETNPTLCTSDYRAGIFLKENYNLTNTINIDLLKNLSNIMERNEKLIYDDFDEVDKTLEDDLDDFCSYKYDLKNIEVIYDESIYNLKNNKKTLEKTFFYGDDDYDKRLLKLIENSSKKNTFNLLLGYYFFLGNEKDYDKVFSNVIEEDEYVETILNSKYLLTGSMQVAIESIASGNKAVLLLRKDKKYNNELINKINIPTIEEDNFENIELKFNKIIENYPKINKIENFKFQEIKNNII